MSRVVGIEEVEQPRSAIAGQTVMRLALGGVLGMHALEKFRHFDAWQRQFDVWYVPEPQLFASIGLGLIAAASAGLILGFWTRLAALIALAEAAFDISAPLARQIQANQLAWTPGLEHALLLAAAALLCLLVGGTRTTLDYALRRRAQQRAIQNDEIWQRPPYIESNPPPAYGGYEPHDAQEAREYAQYSRHRAQATTR